jgi:hypothetical protein
MLSESEMFADDMIEHVLALPGSSVDITALPLARALVRFSLRVSMGACNMLPKDRKLWMEVDHTCACTDLASDRGWRGNNRRLEPVDIAQVLKKVAMPAIFHHEGRTVVVSAPGVLRCRVLQNALIHCVVCWLHVSMYNPPVVRRH